jgi:hypothetical protein
MEKEILYAQLEKLINHGKEDEVKDFLSQNIKSFPEPVQEEIIVSLFRDALVEDVSAKKAIVAYQKEGTKGFHLLTDLIEKLKKKETLLKIKEEL